MARIIFLGTPDFAVPTLDALLKEKHEVLAVITQPDRPSGRGQKTHFSPVKIRAQESHLKIYQPENLRKNTDELAEIMKIQCDFLVVIAYGQILPRTLLEHPRVAPLNVHASLLPAYRGAAPIARAIMEGEEKTGVTIQWMIEALDQGDILHQSLCAIEESDTAQSLHDKLKFLGAEALLRTLKLFETDKITRISQDARIGTYARKLSKEEASLSFNQSAFFVHRAIMGLNPWPVAECHLGGKKLRIFKSRFIPRASDAEPGTVIDTSDGEITVSCLQGCVALMEVQLENRKRMATSEFLRGHPIPTGLILGGPDR